MKVINKGQLNYLEYIKQSYSADESFGGETQSVFVKTFKGETIKFVLNGEEVNGFFGEKKLALPKDLQNCNSLEKIQFFISHHWFKLSSDLTNLEANGRLRGGIKTNEKGPEAPGGVGSQAAFQIQIDAQRVGAQASVHQEVGAQLVGAQVSGGQAVGAQAVGVQAVVGSAVGVQAVGAQAVGAQVVGVQASIGQAAGAQLVVAQASVGQAVGFQASLFQAHLAQVCGVDVQLSGVNAVGICPLQVCPINLCAAELGIPVACGTACSIS